MDYKDIIDFWFKELEPRQWYIKDLEFDKKIHRDFLQIHNKAAAGKLTLWREKALGRLAEIIILDQFSRNMFRGLPASFEFDSLALRLAEEAVSLGCDKNLSLVEKSFLYMPYMHSESQSVHEVAVKLFSQEGLENSLEFEFKHKLIIDKFGRYPHRNEILGRESTAEEVEFLKQPNSSF